MLILKLGFQNPKLDLSPKLYKIGHNDELEDPKPNPIEDLIVINLIF